MNFKKTLLLLMLFVGINSKSMETPVQTVYVVHDRALIACIGIVTTGALAAYCIYKIHDFFAYGAGDERIKTLEKLHKLQVQQDAYKNYKEIENTINLFTQYPEGVERKRLNELKTHRDFLYTRYTDICKSHPLHDQVAASRE